mgnify:CR=1 FL=1
MENFVSFKIKDEENDLVAKIADRYEKNVGKEHLPSDVTISTMTISCHMDTEFKISEIGKYIDLDPNTIVGCKYGTGNIRTVLIQKKRSTQWQKEFWLRSTGKTIIRTNLQPMQPMPYQR